MMLNQTDAHYTPAWLSDRLVAELESIFTTIRAPRIADFAVGDGALLDAVERRFGRRQLIATDVDPGVVRRLRHTHPHWRIGVCDLLNPLSRRGSAIIDGPRRAAHAVVMNPPFSYRGAATFGAFGGVLRCSPALACLAAALEQVARDGKVVTLMPTSTLTSQKDERTWRAIRGFAEVEILEEFSRGVFRGAYADIALISIAAINPGGLADSLFATRYPAEALASTKAPESSAAGADATLQRGCLPMHLAELVASGPEAIPLVHSTDLQKGRVWIQRWVAGGSRILHGPAVLLPRVGQPRPDKVVLFEAGERAVLSDCVIGLSCRSQPVAKRLHNALLKSWKVVVSTYHGSCAPYLTVRDVREAVEKLGFSLDA